MFDRVKEKIAKTAFQYLAAYYPLSTWAGRGFFGGKQAGVAVNKQTALTVSAYWRGINYISEALAGLPWDVVLKGPRGSRFPIERSLDGYLNGQANSELTSNLWRSTMVSKAIDEGNAYAEIAFDSSKRVAGLGHPIERGRCYPYRDSDTGEIFYRVFHAPWNPESGFIDLPQKNIFHLSAFGDGLIGLSLLQYAARTLGIAIAQEENVANYFGNGSMASGTFQKQGKLTMENRETFGKYIKENLSGTNAFKVMVLESGETWTEHGRRNNADDQLLESRKFTVVDMARFLGLPPHILMEYASMTYNNAEQAAIETVRSGLMPWAVRLEHEANFKLVAPRERNRVKTKINLAGLLRADMKTQVEGWWRGIQGGWWSPNDVRSMNEQPPIKGLDYYLKAANMDIVEGTEPIGPDPRSPSQSGPAPQGPMDFYDLDRAHEQLLEAEPIPWEERQQSSVESDQIVEQTKKENAQRVCAVMLEQAWARIITREINSLQARQGKDGFAEWALKWMREKHNAFIDAQMQGMLDGIHTIMPDDDESKLKKMIEQSIVDYMNTALHYLYENGSVVNEQFIRENGAKAKDDIYRGICDAYNLS